MKELGYHEGYKYAHSYEGGFTDEIGYLPEGYENKVYYDPKGYGREKAIRERLPSSLCRKSINKNSLLSPPKKLQAFRNRYSGRILQIERNVISFFLRRIILEAA